MDKVVMDRVVETTSQLCSAGPPAASGRVYKSKRNYLKLKGGRRVTE